MRVFEKAVRAAAVLVALLLLSAPAAAPAQARPLFSRPAAVPAGPAMWVIRDADSTIYLFGTVHVMKPGQVWRSPRIDNALASSDELVLEIAEVDDDAAMIPIVSRLGLDPTRRLSERLTPADKIRFDRVIAAMGANPASFEPMRPWLASLQISVGSLARVGYAGDAGVDRALKASAVAAGKPVRAFETAEQQIHFFADMPPVMEMRMLRQSLDEFDDAPAVFGPLADGWLSGDLRALKRYLVDDWKREEPSLYRVLIVQRNANWARQIEAKLAGSGTSFIAVGAGHLVGPDSVQTQLARHGIRSERY